jgi:hypothetical protein
MHYHSKSRKSTQKILSSELTNEGADQQEQDDERNPAIQVVNAPEPTKE